MKMLIFMVILPTWFVGLKPGERKSHQWTEDRTEPSYWLSAGKEITCPPKTAQKAGQRCRSVFSKLQPPTVISSLQASWNECQENTINPDTCAKHFSWSPVPWLPPSCLCAAHLPSLVQLRRKKKIEISSTSSRWRGDVFLTPELHPWSFIYFNTPSFQKKSL